MSARTLGEYTTWSQGKSFDSLGGATGPWCCPNTANVCLLGIYRTKISQSVYRNKLRKNKTKNNNNEDLNRDLSHSNLSAIHYSVLPNMAFLDISLSIVHARCVQVICFPRKENNLHWMLKGKINPFPAGEFYKLPQTRKQFT